ncbi:MAG TPA: adenylate/guanylate cyclase domain-containing protein [Chryseolinea sp.]|nr:adenylate/guanylate cyclase domain-containing protein [Chryseolinea sp.]
MVEIPDQPEEQALEVEFIGDRKVPILPGQSLLAASLAAGIPHFHACGGQAKCSTCRVIIIDGLDNLNTTGSLEAGLKQILNLPSTVRLACQTKVLREPVKLERLIRDEADIDFIERQQGEEDFILKPMGEEKYVALLFVDVRDFTPFVESSFPFDVIYTMHKILNIFCKAVEEHGGEVVETAGDELFAIFEFNTSTPHAADTVVAAGNAILSRISDMNEKYRELYAGREFEVGIGIHTARVIVGQVNIGGKPKRFVTGLGVNIASRIQQATRKVNNSFLASEEIAKHTSVAENAERCKISLKGVSADATIYLLGRPYKKLNV